MKKIVEPTFSEIRTMGNMPNVSVTGLDFVPPTNIVEKSYRKFVLSFETTLNKEIHKKIDSFSLGNISISFNQKTYKIRNNEAYFFAYDFLNSGAQTFKMCIRQLRDTNINEDQFYFMRMVLPINRIWWLHDIHSYGIETEYEMYGTLFFPKFEKGEIHVYSIKDIHTGLEYMIIEPQYEVTQKEMFEIQYSIAMGLGLITGIAKFDEAYIVASEKNDFSAIIGCSYSILRESIKSQYKIFTTNMYYLNDIVKSGKYNNYALPQIIDENKMPNNTLVNWLEERDYTPIFDNLYKYPEFARAVAILIDGTDKALEYQAALYSVALETICTKLDKIYGIKFGGIIDKAKWDRVRNKTQKTLDNSMKEEGIEDCYISRFNNSLSRMNNISNAEKFKQTISMTKLEISKIDEDAIFQRNLLLHGNLVKSTSKNKDVFIDMFYCSLALYTLCCKIIFKFSGFNGFLVNCPVLLDCKPACDKEAPVLIKI